MDCVIFVTYMLQIKYNMQPFMLNCEQPSYIMFSKMEFMMIQIKHMSIVILIVLFTLIPNLCYAHWADDVIGDFADKGFLPPNITFDSPNQSISKGEAASIINLFYSFEEAFVDYSQSLEVAKSNNYFLNSNIDDFIYREEIPRVICNLSSFDISTDDLTDFIDDAEISKWAKPYVFKLKNEDIINGYPDNSFKPSKYLSFGELITILSRIKGSGDGGLTIIEEDTSQIELMTLEHINGMIYTNDIDGPIIISSGDSIEFAMTVPEGYDENQITISVDNSELAEFDRTFNLLKTYKSGSTNINVLYKDNLIQQYELQITD